MHNPFSLHTEEEPEIISRRTPSQQAETLVPYLTIQHYLPDAGEMSITALYHEAALPGELHICCQPVILSCRWRRGHHL